jgi:hypothetical protein
MAGEISLERQNLAEREGETWAEEGGGWDSTGAAQAAAAAGDRASAMSYFLSEILDQITRATNLGFFPSRGWPLFFSSQQPSFLRANRNIRVLSRERKQILAKEAF